MGNCDNRHGLLDRTLVITMRLSTIVLCGYNYDIFCSNEILFLFSFQYYYGLLIKYVICLYHIYLLFSVLDVIL